MRQQGGGKAAARCRSGVSMPHGKLLACKGRGRLSHPYFETIVFPKGASAKAANLKCCRPKGIPIIVIQSTTPKMRCETQIPNPPRINHKIFINRLRQPPDCGSVRTSLPKGNKASPANLKVCIPKGMPIMVIIIRILDIMYSMQVIIPPNNNHKIFNSIFIVDYFNCGKGPEAGRPGFHAGGVLCYPHGSLGAAPRCRLGASSRRYLWRLIVLSGRSFPGS